MKKRLDLIIGDITLADADAIVNAANNTLLGGGGVDGAIHRAAGPELLEECKKLNGCETGQSKLTSGYRLKAEYVIHTVGPVWHGGHMDETTLLASCYQTSLSIARRKEIRKVAFPAISTGVYGFPKELAAMIAVTETKRFLSKNRFPEKVIFVTFDDESYQAYRRILEK
jgi:O-acetyl-ADP-ribose deacetylase